MVKGLFLSVLLLVVPATAQERINVDNPILVIWHQRGEEKMRVHASPPANYTIDDYAVLIVGIVKFIAGGYKASEEEMWAAVERARLADTIGRQLPGAPRPRR